MDGPHLAVSPGGPGATEGNGGQRAIPLPITKLLSHPAVLSTLREHSLLVAPTLLPNQIFQRLAWAARHSIPGRKYRAVPLRRIYIPKEDGRQRPISIPSLEDKIVQKAAADLLNAIWEQDFLDCSHGFRPGRSPHDALDEVGRILNTRPITTVLEADISGYFDAIVRSLLMEMVEKRVSDGTILRLIGKWINIGAMDQGRLLISETGTGQGQVISPLLANVYLHYVLDEWFETVVKPRLRGEAYEIRFADDFILCFQYRDDAERVLEALEKRFRKYGLTLHPDKTRLMEFGGKALAKSERPGGAKPVCERLPCPDSEHVAEVHGESCH